MKFPISKPEAIEAESFAIIAGELAGRRIPPDQFPVVQRVIHTTADFDFADNLWFSPGVVEKSVALLRRGAAVITDTNMAKAGVNKALLGKLGGEAACFMAQEDVARAAAGRGVTRAAVSMEKAVAAFSGRETIFAVGNAPTALIRLRQLMDEVDFAPGLVIAVPVGFVNVVESKELFLSGDVPSIVARGRKGGSAVAAAVVNALLRLAVSRDKMEEQPAAKPTENS